MPAFGRPAAWPHPARCREAASASPTNKPLDTPTAARVPTPEEDVKPAVNRPLAATANTFRKQMVSTSANPNDKQPLGWHSRGYHPHLDDPRHLQSVGFRLADSVPNHLLERWRDEARWTSAAGDQVRAAELDRLIGRFEDAGHGACYLRQPRIAAMLQDTLLYGDGGRYRLIDWCIMPNHAHVLVEPHRARLPHIIQRWKSVSARRANLILGRTGKFWMEDYYDRYIRDRRHFEAVRRYIWQNPVAAGLCRSADQWPWSSARLRPEAVLGE